jgi:hypothetical protein
LGQVHVLGQLHLAFLERAFQVALLDRVAEVGILVDESDEAVFDLQVHLAALYLFAEVALCLDRET